MDMVIIFLIVTFLFLLSGFPVAFILSGVSLLFAFIGIIFNFFDYSFLMAFPARLFGVMGNQNLLAVPLFIFMGLILEKTKIAENLIHDISIKKANDYYRALGALGLGRDIIAVCKL